MRVLLLYFSGTGHTSLCAQKIKDAFLAQGHEVVSYAYRASEPFMEDVNAFDLIGFGYPIHAFNIPEAFYRFMKAFPSAEKPFFVFKVSGEPFHFNDASSYIGVRALTKKGYRLVGEKHFLMPYNIMFRYRDGLAKQMFLYLGPLCQAFVMGLCAGEAERIRYRFGHKVLSFFLRIEWIAPKINAPLMRASKKKCTHCMLCVKSCPMGAISVRKNGTLKFSSKKCAMCMRCAFFCPHDAVGFGILNPWKVNGPYPFDKLLPDESVDPHFIHEGMKGYFRKFLPYFRKQDALLKEKGIPNPLD
ncbi:MAG: EFR1 family ferrodoxin [Bacilli bacterium]|nr:EFR1 family ferrodoxin [Bacilli bacterium]